MCLIGPSWCSCGRCPRDEIVARRLCSCFEDVYRDEIETYVLALEDSDIWSFPHLWTKTAPPESIATATNKQKRMLSYSKIFRLLHGIGEKGKQVLTPSCMRKHASVRYAD